MEDDSADFAYLTCEIVALEVSLELLPVDGEALHHLVGVDGVADHLVHELLVVRGLSTLGEDFRVFLSTD